MAATGYTVIQLYSSPTASAVPLAANLSAGELAINTNDGKLYYKDSSNVVQVLATKAAAAGSFTTLAASTSVTTPLVTNAGTLALSATGTNVTTVSTNGTERLRITASGGVSFGASGTAYGTSGQILQSNGDAPPTWVANSGISTGKSIAMAMIFGF
jgi:hypothetical protein